MKYTRTTPIMEKGFNHCCICDSNGSGNKVKGITVDTYPDSTKFVCLHCLVDFLTSDEQVLCYEYEDEY